MKLIAEKITLDSGKVISIDRFTTDDGKYQIDMNDLMPNARNEHWHLLKFNGESAPGFAWSWIKSFRTKALAVAYLKELVTVGINLDR